MTAILSLFRFAFFAIQLAFGVATGATAIVISIVEAPVWRLFNEEYKLPKNKNWIDVMPVSGFIFKQSEKIFDEVFEKYK